MNIRNVFAGQQGIALLIPLFMVAGFSLLGTALVNIVIDEIRMANRYTAKAVSFYLAEGALAKGVWQLQQSSRPLTEPATLTGVLETGDYELLLVPREPVGGKQVIEGLALGRGDGAVTKVRVTWEFVYQPEPSRLSLLSWIEED